MHISSIGGGAGKEGGAFCSRTCRFLSSDDIMRVWIGQIKPKNTIIQEQALLCESFLGHLVYRVCTRRMFEGRLQEDGAHSGELSPHLDLQPQTSSHTSRCYLSVPLNFWNTHTNSSSVSLRPDSGFCISGRLLTSQLPSVSSPHKRVHNSQVSRG